MTSIQPDIPDAARYSIRKAADIMGIHRTTLNAYCNSGKAKFGTLKVNGKRFLTGSEIKRLCKEQA